MLIDEYFYNCSKEYICSLNSNLYDDIRSIISDLPVRNTQSEINLDFHHLLPSIGWAYDSKPPFLTDILPEDIVIDEAVPQGKNDRKLCLSSTSLEAGWHADYAKIYADKLVQIEVQFGKVELMFKDFCGFRIAAFEKRLALGIEIVLSEPNQYFNHRKGSISGMAYFEIAKKTLPAIGLDCPIWLIGMK